MRIEDLLKQRRARARKRDDEDRTVLDAGRIGILPGGNILGIAALAGQVDRGRALRRLSDCRGLEEGDLRAMRFLERRVSLVVSAHGIERLGEREEHVMPPQEVVVIFQNGEKESARLLIGTVALRQARLGQQEVGIAADGLRSCFDPGQSLARLGQTVGALENPHQPQ